ncbi:MAG: hypothetical protein KDA90_22780 [Planctomycetaceae bacterium]|nr:hypothetical protein [Planctomycetaceae bacterium]
MVGDEMEITVDKQIPYEPGIIGMHAYLGLSEGLSGRLELTEVVMPARSSFSPAIPGEDWPEPLVFHEHKAVTLPDENGLYLLPEESWWVPVTVEHICIVPTPRSIVAFNDKLELVVSEGVKAPGFPVVGGQKVVLWFDNGNLDLTNVSEGDHVFIHLGSNGTYLGFWPGPGSGPTAR